MVPVLPFFWLSGTTGVIVAAAVSLVAHFAVGAAKSLFTLRTAWSAGIEMTIAGAIVGGPLTCSVWASGPETPQHAGSAVQGSQIAYAALLTGR